MISGLANALGIHQGMTAFPHPTRTGKWIRWIFDVPHLLKLMRNALLGKGFIMGTTKTEFGLADFEQLLEKLEASDISIAPRLTRSHLYVNGQDKQDVRVAAQLISMSVSQAFQHLFPEDEKMREVARVLLAFGKLVFLKS